MEEQWVILAVCTVAAMVAMFTIGYWLEGQSSSPNRRARRQAAKNKQGEPG